MAWSCEQCGRNVVSNDLLCDLCHAAKPGADPEKVALGGQRDLIMEAHLRALALWYRIGAVLLVVGMVLMTATGMAATRGLGGMGGFGGDVMGGVLMTLAVITLLSAGGAYVLGHFLARYSNGARITGGVLTAIGLAWVVLSTVLAIVRASSESSYYDPYGGGYGARHYYGHSSGFGFGSVIITILYLLWIASVLWALFNKRSSQICSPRYRDIVARTPELTPPTFKSPFFIIPTALTVFAILFSAVLILPRL